MPTKVAHEYVGGVQLWKELLEHLEKYRFLTFESDISEENYLTVKGEMDRCYSECATQARIIVKLVDRILPKLS